MSIAPNICIFSFSISYLVPPGPTNRLWRYCCKLLNSEPKKEAGSLAQLPNQHIVVRTHTASASSNLLGTILLPLLFLRHFAFFATLLCHFLPFVVSRVFCKLGTCALVSLLTAMRPLKTFLRNFFTITIITVL